MELPGIQRQCYGCYIVGINEVDCDYYSNIIELGCIKPGERCLTLKIIDDDLDKTLRNDGCATYQNLVIKILEDTPDSLKHPVPKLSSHCPQ
jgi:hypothetical protein